MRLDELYAPKRIDDIIGQELLDVTLWLERPTSQCWLFYGQGGTGKTTAAGCIVNQLDVHDLDYTVLEGGDLSKDRLEVVLRELRCRPMLSKWRVLHLEEFERLSPQAQVLLKTRLDIANMPSHLIVTACTNSLSNLDDALLQRFDMVEFKADQVFVDSCEDRLVEIWLELMPNSTPPPEAARWGKTHSGSFSMRVALRDLDRHYRKEKALCRC